MKQFHKVCLFLLIVPTYGITVREPPQSNEIADRLGRLFVDVDESVQKSGEDAEVMFTQLYEYDQKLKASVRHDLEYLNKTRAQLIVLHSKFSSESNQSKRDAQRFDRLLHDSKNLQVHYRENASHANAHLKTMVDRVGDFVAAFRKSAKSLPKDGLQNRLAELQELLNANEDLQPRFQDVFAAFADSQSTAEASLSPRLQKRAMLVMEEIRGKLRKQRARALLQIQTRQESLSTKSSEAEMRVRAALGAHAEGERKVEELAFSIVFANAAIKADETFYSRIQNHMQAKAELVEAIRTDRQNQQTTISDLTDLLKGKFSVPVSFLQRQVSRNSVSSALQTEIESALRSKKDTHAILLRVKARLNQAVPIDVGNVRDVVANLGRALHAVDSVHASADDARRRCEVQEFNARQEKQRLQSSLQLVSVSQNHTGAAILSTRKNLNSILAKQRVLNASSEDFFRLAGQATNVFKKQGRDRATILAALRKAQDLTPRAVASEAVPGAVALLSQLVGQFQSQEKNERDYKSKQDSLKADLSEYKTTYNRLLAERRMHYEATLSALGLYASELAGDELSRSGILNNDAELQAEGQELCDSILGFYSRHDARRLKLSNALRAVLPKVPEILNSGNDADGSDS